jgi:hypothetical protein
MTQKLTLRFDADTIERAKRIAKKRNTSLSKMVDKLLKKEIIESNDLDETEIAAPLKKAKGKKPHYDISDADLKEAKKNYLLNKH